MGKYHVCPACGRPESPWISVEDRLPTEEDADRNGSVYGWLSEYGRPEVVYFKSFAMPLSMHTHWQEIKGP